MLSVNLRLVQGIVQSVSVLYNFPQNRVTDHRIGLTLQKLDRFLAGKMDEVIDALVLYDQTQKLEELNK